MARNESDNDLAFRLQMEEAFAASISLRSPYPATPVARCGIAIAIADDRRNLTRERELPQVSCNNRGFDVGKPSGERSSDADRNHKKAAVTGSLHVKSSGDRSSDTGRNHEKPQGKGIIHQRPSGSAANYGKAIGDGGQGKKPLVPQSSKQFCDPAKAAGEGSSKGAALRFRDDVVYRLYFKGLVSEEMIRNGKKAVLAGIGVAICDQKDNLLFEIKGPLLNNGMSRQAAEIRALIGGLNEAVSLGIKRITVYCDYYPIYQFIIGKWVPKQKKIASLMDHVYRLKSQFTISNPILVARKDVKFAFKLARQAIISQINTSAESGSTEKGAPKETCVICLDDADAERIFSVDKCSHRYCFSCVKQYVEVKLLHGVLPKCPHDKCKSELNLDTCGKLLTPKLIDMWKQRMKEASIPVTEKVYCPHPRCSALMSKTEVLDYSRSILGSTDSGVRKCLKCHGLFCINCKVSWHTNLSCSEYKKLNPNPSVEDVKLKSLAKVNLWRQCVKCQHMIELSEGCYHMTCRCGYEFCYNCGAEWKNKKATCSCPLWDEDYILDGNGGDFDDDEEEDEDDYDYDYDYDYDDFLDYDHPFVGHDFDDLPFDYTTYGFVNESFDSLESQHYDPTAGSSHPLFEGDDFWDDEDFGFVDEGFPVPAGQDGVVHAKAGSISLEDDGDWFEEVVEEEETEEGSDEEYYEEEEQYVEEDREFEEDGREMEYGGAEEYDGDYYDEGNCHFGDDFGYGGDDFGNGGDDFDYGGADEYDSDSDWY